MKKSLLVLAMAIPLSTMAATPKTESTKKATPAPAPAIEDNPFTPQRNKAAGAISTTIVIMQKMSKGCVNKGGVTEEKIKISQQNFADQNQVFLQMHRSYLSGFFGAIKETNGEEAAIKANSDMVKMVNEQADVTINDMTGKYKTDEACKKYFDKLATGGFNIKEGYPEYKTIVEMVEYSGLKVPVAKK
ncbi:hypothetical protein HQ393_05780 [Chitinibacter bivalviorum]|uniref:Uncharacterized protein n=1 Tax=Chitinibacter bivalviorum TaxID=2739434 RepID=A0A7H9BHQ6_9NEIS|nr:hypothetical protein [Chitinibacter bivalviorum]QLG87806.1 hypothetical protein HQ393_05780 [Chitinibacter bivalviorum]